MSKEISFEGINQELNKASKEINDLKQVEKTFGDFLHNSVNDLLKQKGLRNFGHIRLDRDNSSEFQINFYLNEIEKSRINDNYIPTKIAKGDFASKKIEFFPPTKDRWNSWKNHPSYLNGEIVPFLGDTFQKCGFSIEPKELVQEIQKRNGEVKKIDVLDKKKFTEAKKKFLEELKNLPEPKELPNPDELDLLINVAYRETSFSDVMLGILNLSSLYGLNESMKTIDTAIENLLKEKPYKDPHYKFALGVFSPGPGPIGGTASTWEVFHLFLPYDRYDYDKAPFFEQFPWKEDTQKRIADILPLFKNENPENKKRLKDIFVVTKDLIRSL